MYVSRTKDEGRAEGTGDFPDDGQAANGNALHSQRCAHHAVEPLFCSTCSSGAHAPCTDAALCSTPGVRFPPTYDTWLCVTDAACKRTYLSRVVVMDDGFASLCSATSWKRRRHTWHRETSAQTTICANRTINGSPGQHDNPLLPILHVKPPHRDRRARRTNIPLRTTPPPRRPSRDFALRTQLVRLLPAPRTAVEKCASPSPHRCFLRPGPPSPR